MSLSARPPGKPAGAGGSASWSAHIVYADVPGAVDRLGEQRLGIVVDQVLRVEQALDAPSHAGIVLYDGHRANAPDCTR